MKKKIVLLAAAAALLTFTACGNSGNSAQTDAAQSDTAQTEASASDTAETDASSQSDGGVRKIKYAFTNTLKPVSYVEADGSYAGYDVEVIKKIDELLPQYEIEFVGTTSEDAWMGTESGKYQLCTTNSFKTPEREKKYLFADLNQGGNPEGLVLRKENADVKDLKDVADQGLSMVPLRPSDAIYSVINTWNEENPDHQVKLEEIDQLENADAIRYVAQGRYDVFPFAGTMWKSMVEADDGELHDLNDKLTFNVFTAFKTYALINKDETEFLEAYQTALHQLKDDGTLKELSEKYLGEDVFKYFDE